MESVPEKVYIPAKRKGIRFCLGKNFGGFFMEKKRIAVIAIALIAITVCAIFGLTACGDGKGKGDVTVVIACDGSDKEYYVDADEVDGEGVMAILVYLKENKGLHLIYSESAYGAYITEIGNFKEGNGEYVYFFTSVEKDYDVSEYAQAVNYKGQTLTSSGVGVSQMSVEEDAVIYIGKIKY